MSPRGLANASVLLYSLTLSVAMLASAHGVAHRVSTWLRCTWSLGCLLMLLHVLSAFHSIHQWDHEAAVAHTALVTRRVVGMSFGAGLYVNYFFLTVWVLDVAWWWIRGAGTYVERRRVWTLSIHGFMFFVVFNGSVIFATGGSRLFGGICAATVIGCVWYRSWRRWSKLAPDGMGRPM